MQHVLTHEHQHNEELPSLLTIEHRRTLYDERIRTLMKIGHIRKKDMKDLIEQAKSILMDGDEDKNNSKKQNETTYYRRSVFLSDRG